VSSDRLTVLYDADCGICTHTARALAALDSRHRLNLVALQAANLPDVPPRAVLSQALHSVDETGSWSVGADAMIEIARRVPLLWPLSVLARLPLAMPVVDVGYRAVAENRQRLSQLLGLKVCRVPSREA
jgi:predicted DCC family thiol-disulfide oxidoreductase YuxK